VKAATQTRARRERKLLTLGRRDGAIAHARLDDLPSLLAPGDALVVNDAATLPAALPATFPSGAPGELRLVRQLGNDGRAPGGDGRAWRAVTMGAGDWRTPTEKRPLPEPLAAGDALVVAGLPAQVIAVSPRHARLVDVLFDAPADDAWRAIYERGRPIQYAHVPAPLPLWSVQTPFAARPWAVEAPSAGLPLDWELLTRLAARGVALAAVSHGAGLSSTGDAALDAALPLPERYEVPPATQALLARVRRDGGRVVACGTSVVRALESFALAGAAAGETELLIGPGHRLRAVDGLLTGMHDPTASHFALLHAFAPRAALDAAYREAERAGYLGHEFGDCNLIL
jgi:S-adenosylmethionine:tRNA ribosyltransferase-isomerase